MTAGAPGHEARDGSAGDDSAGDHAAGSEGAAGDDPAGDRAAPGDDAPPRIRTGNSGSLAGRLAEEAAEAPASEAPAERPWWHAGIRFECSACGKCCTQHGEEGEYAYVYSTRAERKALAEHFGLSLRAFEREYIEVHATGVRSFKSVDGACAFLGEDGRCTVYALRPGQCRTFPFWRDVLADRDTWERDVASFCPGVGEGPLHDAEAIARRMADPGAP